MQRGGGGWGDDGAKRLGRRKIRTFCIHKLPNRKLSLIGNAGKKRRKFFGYKK